MNEKQQLFEAVDKFAMLMKERFDSKRKQGWSGWDYMGGDILAGRLLMNAAQAVINGDDKSLVDVANLAMIIQRNKKGRK